MLVATLCVAFLLTASPESHALGKKEPSINPSDYNQPDTSEEPKKHRLNWFRKKDNADESAAQTNPLLKPPKKHRFGFLHRDKGPKVKTFKYSKGTRKMMKQQEKHARKLNKHYHPMKEHRFF